MNSVGTGWLSGDAEEESLRSEAFEIVETGIHKFEAAAEKLVAY